MNPPKAIFCWSGGKDSAQCLHKVFSEKQYDVKYLLTTLNAMYKRISMHGVKEELVDMQAKSLGIPLKKVWVSEGSNAEYEQQMEAVLLQAKAEGINHVIFGDIFLEDLRAYREANLAKVGMQAVFPLWKMDTKQLLQGFMQKGFKTITCCTNSAYLGEEWVGREIDSAFVKELPTNVDPCGENGEYHTFCFDGPIFQFPISFTVGEKVFRPLEIKETETSTERGFWYYDLIPNKD